MKSEEKLKSDLLKAKELLSEYNNSLGKEMLRRDAINNDTIKYLSEKISKLEIQIATVEWVLSDEPEPEPKTFEWKELKSYSHCEAMPFIGDFGCKQ